MKVKFMNNIIFKLTKGTFFEKYVFENEELKRRHKKFIKLFLVFAILALPLLIANLIIGVDADALGFLGFFLMAWAFLFWGGILAFELADKITRKQQ